MKMRGIPIDGVGMQMHVGASNNAPSAAQLATNMRRYAALGLKIVISELDVQICASTQAAQQTRYHDLIAACMAEPACTAVTVWGITDKFSWLNGQACASAMGLLFDANYAKKPAYTGVLDALNGR
jgi:endo-1,4-beta-xylanase